MVSKKKKKECAFINCNKKLSECILSSTSLLMFDKLQSETIRKIYSKIRFSRHERARFERLMQELTYSEASKLITNHWQKTAYWHASDLSDKMRIYCIRKGFLFV